jgi:hypothetical protein
MCVVCDECELALGSERAAQRDKNEPIHDRNYRRPLTVNDDEMNLNLSL